MINNTGRVIIQSTVQPTEHHPINLPVTPNAASEISANTFATVPNAAENESLSGHHDLGILDTRSSWGIPDENLTTLQKLAIIIYRLVNHFAYKGISCLPTIDDNVLKQAKQQYVGVSFTHGANVLSRSTTVGEELGPSHITLYFEEILSKELENTPFKYVSLFIEPEFTFHKKNEETILTELQQAVTNPNEPVVIPFVIPKSLFSENHIAEIVVKGDTIYYVDSKGPTLDNQKTRDGTPLREVLEKAFPGKNIIQNTVVHQECISNCGAYVCKFARDILKSDNFDLEERFGIDKIIAFRRDMFSKFVNLFLSKVGQPATTPTPQTPPSSEDFEM